MSQKVIVLLIQNMKKLEQEEEKKVWNINTSYID